tara:strand:+ start:4881 stop:6401 length:1521 start_codon:yes stop_codon:yes gene_type:complete
VKLLIASFKHETNTFSSVPTPLSRFYLDGRLPAGDDAIRQFRGSGSVLGGMLEVLDAAVCEYLLPVAAEGWPSGPVHDDAFEHIAGKICKVLAEQSVDGILLDLHGAMVTQSYTDGEGELLRRVRELAPRVPIAVSLDMHANVSPDIVDALDILCGYQTYPHVDERETGARAARLLLRTVRGEIQPALAWGSVPMLPHVMAQSSLDEPNRSLQARCMAANREGVLDASLFTGFPHADTPHSGLSAVVISDGDRRSAAHLRDGLLADAWAVRGDFEFAVEPLSESVALAKRLADEKPGKPVFILDHYDNAASGGSMQELAVLKEILRQELKDVVFFALFAPDAVEVVQEAGIGAAVQLALEHPGEGASPLLVQATVQQLSDGRATAENEHHEGIFLGMGASALVRCEGVDIILISLPMEPFDVTCFTHFGVDIANRRFVVLKSRVHWRAAFEDMVGATVPCAGSGACTSNYDELDFQRVRRPIYPLDPVVEFEPLCIEKFHSRGRPG